MKFLLVICLPFLTQWEEPHPSQPDESVVQRRWVYPSAREGSGKEIHNRAVAAERSGNLQDALDLSREAYVLDPRRWEMAYLERLELRVADRDALADLTD